MIFTAVDTTDDDDDLVPTICIFSDEWQSRLSLQSSRTNISLLANLSALFANCLNYAIFAENILHGICKIIQFVNILKCVGYTNSRPLQHFQHD